MADSVNNYISRLQKSLQMWQDLFFESQKVYGYCLDGEHQFQTEFTGMDSEKTKLMEAVTQDRIRRIIQRVSESELEDQAIESTDSPNVKLAASCFRNREGKPVYIWVLIGVLTDAENDGNYYSLPSEEHISRTTTERGFFLTLDVLRASMQEMITVVESRNAAVEQSVQSRHLEQQMSAHVRRAEAMTEIVSLLDSDDSIEAVMESILETVGGYLDISGGMVCQTHRSDDLIDIVVQWSAPGCIPFFEESKNVERPWYLKTTRSLFVSQDQGVSAQERAQLEEEGIKTLAVLPVTVSSGIGFFVVLTETREDRTLDLDEIKFASDAVRILQSIVTKRIQKNSLASSYNSLQAILDNVGSSIYVRDIDTNCMLFANRSLQKQFSLELRDGTLEDLFEHHIPPKSKGGNMEIYHEARDRWYEVYYTHIIWVDGKEVSLYAIYDITEKKVYQKRIEQQAYTDFLTGLYNRMCCERDLARYIDEAEAEGGKGAVFYLDLDDFKHINDGLGHQYGDLLLKTISQSLQGIKGIHNTCYRMGGDEFVIIVPTESFAMFDRIVNDIQTVFAKPWFLKDADYYCTMSMGTVEFPTEGTNVADLIKKADIAMYEAKKTGKNRIAKYSDEIDTSSSRRLDMEKNMRDAMLKDYSEFEIYYQPLIDAQRKGSPCHGAEALVRWNSRMGFISPAEFIPLAEYLGLITPIGNHVLDEACLACKSWNDNGHPDYQINVNLSVVQLLQPDIFDVIQAALEKSKLNPKNLVLEITESLAINDLARTKQILANIKKLGVRVALDDFGTGYSSLSNLRELPFDIIKVDQNFVKNLAEDSFSQAFIRMIVELGEAIGAEIVVEGIETELQYKVLETMKVNYIQGYYFDKPLPRDSFEDKYVSEDGPKKPGSRLVRTMNI